MTTLILIKALNYSSPSEVDYPSVLTNNRVTIYSACSTCLTISKQITTCLVPRFSRIAKVRLPLINLFTSMFPHTFRFTREFAPTAPVYGPTKSLDILTICAPFLFQIQELDCSGILLTNGVWKMFVNLLPVSARATLEYLDISYAQFDDSLLPASVCPLFPNLKSLNCHRAQDLSEKSLESIGQNLTLIQYLNFTDNDNFITVRSISKLVSEKLGSVARLSLRRLVLNDCYNLNDACLKEIAENCVSLVDLSIRHCNLYVTLDGVLSVVDSSTCVFAHQLEALHLAGLQFQGIEPEDVLQIYEALMKSQSETKCLRMLEVCSYFHFTSPKEITSSDLQDVEKISKDPRVSVFLRSAARFFTHFAPSLKKLRLGSCSSSHAVIEALAKFWAVNLDYVEVNVDTFSEIMSLGGINKPGLVITY